MAFVCESMNSTEPSSNPNQSSTNDDEDEELAQLRLAALLSRKSTNQKSKQKSNENDSSTLPQSSSFIRTQTGTSRKCWPIRRRGVPTQKINTHRSNLIVINPVGHENLGDGIEAASYPKLVLPQHRWCASSNDDSMSPNSSNCKKKDASRFSRFESDSDSDSDLDFNIPNSSSGDSEQEETILEDAQEKQILDGNVQNEEETVCSNILSPKLEIEADTVDIVEPNVSCNHLENEAEKVNEADTLDSLCPFVSETSEHKAIKPCGENHLRLSPCGEKDSHLDESADVADILCANKMPKSPVLNNASEEGKITSVDVKKEPLSKRNSSPDIITEDLDFLPLEEKHLLLYSCIETKDVNSFTGKHKEAKNPQVLNTEDFPIICVKKLEDNHCGDVAQSLSKNDLRHELKKRTRKRNTRDRCDRYSDGTSSSDSDSSSKSSYSDQKSSSDQSSDSPSFSDEESSDDSVNPPIKSVLSVVKPISLESSDIQGNFAGKGFQELSVGLTSKSQSDKKASQRVAYHSSIEDVCNFHPRSSKKRRSSSSSVEKNHRSPDDYKDKMSDKRMKKRLPVHMRLGVPAKKFAAGIDDDAEQFSKSNKYCGKYINNDPNKGNLRIEVSDTFNDQDNDFEQPQIKSNWRKKRSTKDDSHKKRKVTW